MMKEQGNFTYLPEKMILFPSEHSHPNLGPGKRIEEEIDNSEQAEQEVLPIRKVYLERGSLSPLQWKEQEEKD